MSKGVGAFEKEDFMIDDCEEINSMILKEASTFVTFMQAIISELLGKEDHMVNILVNSFKHESVEEDNDEEFDD